MKEKRDAPSLTTLDSIAELVPIQQRKAFFRRMAFMRKLSEDDEALMIIDAMALLTKLTIDAPAQLASEP